jgi:hypothetical protein
VALIKCPDCGKDVSSVAPSCPNCGRPISKVGPATAAKKQTKTSPFAMGCFVLLLAAFALWVIGTLSNGPASSSDVAKDVTNRPTGEPPIPFGPQLELVKYAWHIEYGYAILEGQVKNISSQPLKNVTAVASFYDASSGFITSSDALIDFNPVLPGQTSPFKVMATQNPAMKKGGVEFKSLMGGSIPFRDAESRRGTRK